MTWEPGEGEATEGGTVVRTEEMPYWSLITLSAFVDRFPT